MLTALGNDVASTWDGLVAGRSGVRRIEAFDPSRLTSQIAAEVHDFDPSDVLDRKEMRRTDRYIQFGLVVARQALDQAGLPGRLDGELAERTGVILGSGLGGVNTLFDNVLVMAERGPDRISPFFIPMGIANVGRGPGRDRLRTARPELRDRLGLRHRRPRDRRGVGDDPPRRRRRDDRRRRRGADPRGRDRRVLLDEGALDPQRRSGRRRRGRSTAIATGSSSARAPGRSSSRRSSTPRRAARRRWPSSSATGRPPTPRTSPCRRPAGSAPSGPPGGRSRRPGSSRRRSTT